MATLLSIVAPTAIFADSVESVEIEGAHSSRPNIVFIFADDLGFGDIGLYGATQIATPNIDALGKKGIALTEFYAISPVCSPSRAGLLTGRYPVRMGIHHVFFPHSITGMPNDEVTIAELLQDAGYRTGMVGKWHLGHRERYLPLQQGFDEFFGMPYSNDMSPYPYMRGNEFVDPVVDQAFVTKTLTAEAINFIDRYHDKPFFLYIAHAMPHVPIFASPEFKGKSPLGPYGDVIEELDWSVGQVVAALDRQEVLENTLVVFTSDNGPWLLMGEEGGSAGPLRNGKGSTFEGGMRVPTVAMWPKVIPAGQVSNDPATMLDWLPTIAAMADAKLPDDRVIDGIDIMPLLTGTADEDPRQIAYYFLGQLQAFRHGDWKLKLPFDGSFISPLIRFILRFTDGFETHELLLFNLKEDPGETRNLASAHPEKVRELQAAIAQFKVSLGDLPPNINEGPGLAIKGATKVVIMTGLQVFGLILLFIMLLVCSGAFFLGRYRRK